MLRAAIFSAEQMVSARFCRLEPRHRVTAGHNVGLRAESRNEVRVNYILAGHGQLDTAAGRYVQGVDLTLAIGVLRAPHPLFTRNEDFQRLLRWGIHLVIKLC